MIIVVDPSHDLCGNLLLVLSELVQEDELGETTVAVQMRKVGRRALPVRLLVTLCQCLRLCGCRRAEVLVQGQSAAAIDPALPVELLRDVLAIRQLAYKLVKSLGEVL